MRLRPYQEKTLSMLSTWFREHEGNPCIVLPTGAGKSVILAAFCERSLSDWPDTRILVLTHVKELIEQDAKALLRAWPFAPVGICSAGLGKDETAHAITFAGIQTMHRRKPQRYDLVIVDECHLINTNATGMYRTFLDKLREVNPRIRVIGLTATPYRLGQGMVTDGDGLFDEPIIEPVTIKDLQTMGFLAKVRSRATDAKLSTEGVGVRGGEYIESELQKAVNVLRTNEEVVAEMTRLADSTDAKVNPNGVRRHWLVFCAGVDHAHNICEELNAIGVTAGCVTGSDSIAQRDATISSFKSGQLRSLVNVSVLTTGFDYPDIDMIVFLRPTMSPGLYLQMAGRGLRLKSDGGDCLALDFAGVISTHGPITNVQPPRKKGKGTGMAPSKVCPECLEICLAFAKQCPNCGHDFPFEPPTWKLADDDISGYAPKKMEVSRWKWGPHVSQSSGNISLKVTYYGTRLSDMPICEYLAVGSSNTWAHSKAVALLKGICDMAGVSILSYTYEELCQRLSEGKPPIEVTYRKTGKFNEVINRAWEDRK